MRGVSRTVKAPARVLQFGVGQDGQGDWPLVFESRGSIFRVDLAEQERPPGTAPLAERFRVVRPWWEGPLPADGPEEDEFFRVPLVGGGLVELIREPNGQWMLYKVYD